MASVALFQPTHLRDSKVTELKAYSEFSFCVSVGFIWLLVRSLLSRSNPSNMTRITNVNGNSCIARGSMGAGPEEEMWSVLKKRMNVIHEDAKKQTKRYQGLFRQQHR